MIRSCDNFFVFSNGTVVKGFAELRNDFKKLLKLQTKFLCIFEIRELCVMCPQAGKMLEAFFKLI